MEEVGDVDLVTGSGEEVGTLYDNVGGQGRIIDRPWVGVLTWNT